MSKIKLGVIGVGNMGRSHCKNIKDGKCPEIELVAIADSNPKRVQAMIDDGYENVIYFENAEEMMDSGLVDSVNVSKRLDTVSGLSSSLMYNSPPQVHFVAV